MAASRQFDARLPLSGSSRELDTLTETFNALMASVAAAEAETEAAYTAAIRALAAALDARDPYTAGHSERVSVLSVAIGRVAEPGPRRPRSAAARRAAPRHRQDRRARRRAAQAGTADRRASTTPSSSTRCSAHGFCAPCPSSRGTCRIVELHHERPDGDGYPHGLRGDDIPLAAHIVHVADAYDAMTSARAYRPGRPSATRCASCGAAPARTFTRRSSVRSPRRCRASRPPSGNHSWRRTLPSLQACSVLVRRTDCLRVHGVGAVGRAGQRRERGQHQPLRRRERPGTSGHRGRRHRHRAPRQGLGGVCATLVPQGLLGSLRDLATEIYQAAVQYERSGRVSTRVDLGYILSPIGLGMMDMRPDTNPTITPHLSYVIPMPAFDAGVPSSLPIASSYPLGGQVTASTTLWDARAAVVSVAAEPRVRAECGQRRILRRVPRSS